MMHHMNVLTKFFAAAALQRPTMLVFRQKSFGFDQSYTIVLAWIFNALKFYLQCYIQDLHQRFTLFNFAHFSSFVFAGYLFEPKYLDQKLVELIWSVPTC